jgi:hypothetical protein
MADGTLSLNSRELEDGDGIEVTELSPEGHGIAQDVEDILDADHMSPSMVNDEELPLEQARARTPPSPLPRNKGKGHAQTLSKDSVIVRPRRTSSWISRRDPCHDDNRRPAPHERQREGRVLQRATNAPNTRVQAITVRTTQADR